MPVLNKNVIDGPPAISVDLMPSAPSSQPLYLKKTCRPSSSSTRRLPCRSLSARNPIYSFLNSVSRSGYLRQGTSRRSVPGKRVSVAVSSSQRSTSTAFAEAGERTPWSFAYAPMLFAVSFFPFAWEAYQIDFFVVYRSKD